MSEDRRTRRSDGPLPFHGTVVLEDGLELVVGTEGLGFAYPFTVEDVTAMADELSAAD